MPPGSWRFYDDARGLGNNLGACDCVHRLPGLEVDLDLAAGLVFARRARDGNVECVFVGLLDYALGSTQLVLKLAQQGRIADSDSHGRRQARYRRASF